MTIRLTEGLISRDWSVVQPECAEDAHIPMFQGGLEDPDSAINRGNDDLWVLSSGL
jgi:hypothetical protein